MALDMKQFMDVFLEEADEQIQIMEDKILLLEQGDNDKETIQSLFRAAHTLKGSSAAMGFDTVKEITHELESLLDLIRTEKLKLEDALIELLIQGVDTLKELKEAVVSGTDGSVDIKVLTRKIIQYREASLSDSLPDLVSDLVSDQKGDIPPLQLNLDERYHCLEGKEQGKEVLEIVVILEDDSPMKMARSSIIQQRISELTEIVVMTPIIDDHAETLNDELFKMMQFVVITDSTVSELQKTVASLMEVAHTHIRSVELEKMMEEVYPQSAAVDEHKQMSSQTLNSLQTPTVIKDSSQPPVASPQPPAQDRRKSRSIRVDVERLENLMNLVGELLIDQVGIKQTSRELKQKYQKEDDFGQLLGQTDHLGRVIHELQEQVMKIRMLPVEQLFSRLPRIVRDLSKQLEKEIELRLIGGETEIDRTVIEEISDPLIHLIRNGVDHGIESEEERIRNGKPAKGTLTIQASHEGNQVVIRVKDDGGGINPISIKQSALNKGIITEETAAKLTDREAIQLIFKPGFSTAAVVSDVSGRGVGMDIVRDHIEKLNGIIEIQSEIGKGTEFHIRLPLTLAIIPGLQIKVNGTSFILPMSNVLEIIRLKPEEIDFVRGEPVISLRGEVLPLLSLQDILGWEKQHQEKKFQQIVIVGMAEKRVALRVDELNGNADIVVKSVGNFVGRTKCITGATILGDGKVALIFDIGSLF